MSSSSKLSVWRAIRDALCGADASYFPQLPQGELPENEKLEVYTLRVIRGVLDGIDTAKVPEKAVDTVLDQARETLKEVKGLTEYQDQKATRILTIIAFLSALGGALFAKFAESHLLAENLWGDCFNFRSILIVACYATFAAFEILAVSGALVIFYAIETRFKWPSKAQSVSPTSRLFFRGIVSVKPEDWAYVFVQKGSGNKQLAEPVDLKLAYAKDYIGEAYLVAAKVADKLRYLEPGQKLLNWAIVVLLIWAILSAISSAVPQ